MKSDLLILEDSESLASIENNIEDFSKDFNINSPNLSRTNKFLHALFSNPNFNVWLSDYQEMLFSQIDSSPDYRGVRVEMLQEFLKAFELYGGVEVNNSTSIGGDGGIGVLPVGVMILVPGLKIIIKPPPIPESEVSVYLYLFVFAMVFLLPVDFSVSIDRNTNLRLPLEPSIRALLITPNDIRTFADIFVQYRLS
jgi:hypothetical protein